uniref:Uncharacterized protein n=1 Tax=Mesocestoides corti TaxID=53468 RepID=A0A5K3EW68_MESCO
MIMSSFSPQQIRSHLNALIEPPRKPSLPQLFLGGACNPTTWRQEKAIPVLEQEKIPYYNPQVEEWSPELIALEREAKERSFLLLFVFDPNLTRGLASLVEVAYLAALGRRLVIVRPNIKKLRVMATGNRISRIEAKCIAEAFQWLDGIRLPNVSVFDTLEEALIYLKLQYLSRGKRKKRHSSTGFNVSRYTKTPKRTNASALQDAKYAQIRLLEAYKFLPSLPLVISDFTPDVYCGGDTQFCENGHSNKTWVIPRRTRRSFKLTLSIQSLCREFYFYISKDNLWLVDQMEAAFAIGSGKKVTLCIEYLSDDTRSQNSSGYSSLASTPQDTFQPPPTSANTDLPCVLPTHPPYPHLACPANLALSPTAIKDHNRSRAYLKSLAEETNNAVLGHPLRGLRDLM